MKKKLFSIFAIVLVMVMAFTLFAACDDPNDPDDVDDIVLIGNPSYYVFDSIEVYSVPEEYLQSISIAEFEMQMERNYIASEQTLILYDNYFGFAYNYCTKPTSWLEYEVKDGKLVADQDSNVNIEITKSDDTIEVYQGGQASSVIEMSCTYKKCDPPSWTITSVEEVKPDDYYDRPIAGVEGKTFVFDSLRFHDENLTEEEKDQEFFNEIIYGSEMDGYIYGKFDFIDDSSVMVDIFGESHTVGYRVEGNNIIIYDDNGGGITLVIEDNLLSFDVGAFSGYSDYTIYYHEDGAPIEGDVSGKSYIASNFEIEPQSSYDKDMIIEAYGSIENFESQVHKIYQALEFISIAFHADGTAYSINMYWMSNYSDGICKFDYIQLGKYAAVLYDGRQTFTFVKKEAEGVCIYFEPNDQMFDYDVKIHMKQV